MKILIISRTIFPSQHPRSLRATELAKELARQGHEVILYAVLGKYDYKSFEKENNLIVRNIGKMSFAKSSSDGPVKNNFIVKVFTKLFKKLLEFPDIELMFKLLPILKNEKNTNLLITIAIPHPIHWGAAFAKGKLKSKFPSIWIADCGDPYMGNKFYNPYFYFRYIEKWFCKKADFITVPLEEAKKGYYPEFENKIKVIPQGFNFSEVKINTNFKPNSIPTFAYSGAFYKPGRDPAIFLEYLAKMKEDFKFIIYTKSKGIVASFVDKLGNKLDLRETILRDSLIYELSNMDFLINFENGTSIHSPSKLIDYTLTGRPILSVDCVVLNKEKLNEFIKGNYQGQLHVSNIEQYNIKNVVKKFLQLAERR